MLDVMLPDLDGLEVTRRLRRDGLRIPVLFLTARDATEDKVAGLDRRWRRLRHQAVQPGRGRRPRPRHPAPRRRRPPATTSVLRFADLVLDEESHEVWRADTPVHLTATEFNLLRYFMLNPRRVLSKAQILDHVWNYDFDGDDNVVETFVSYLRKKLDRLGPPLIHTVRLVGYALRQPRVIWVTARR